MSFRLVYSGNQNYFPLDSSEVQAMIKIMLRYNRRAYLGAKLLCWVAKQVEIPPKEYYTNVIGGRWNHMIEDMIEKEDVHWQ